MMYAYIYMSVCMHVCMYKYVYVSMYEYVCMSVCMFMIFNKKHHIISEITSRSMITSCVGSDSYGF